jgi:hypothetical protein
MNDDIDIKITRKTTKTIELSLDQIEKVLKKYFLSLEPDEIVEFIWPDEIVEIWEFAGSYSSSPLIIKIEKTEE